MVEENGATITHARTTLCSPIEQRRCLLGSRQEKPGSAIASGPGEFIWDHRMTGPEGGAFPGAARGLAQSEPRTSACKDVHALWLTGSSFRPR